MSRRRWMAVAMVAALAAAGGAAAHDPEAAGPGPGGAMPERVAKRLDLTQDQQAKIKALNEAHRAAMKPKWEAQEALLKDLRELVKSKAGDAALSAKLDALKQGHLAIQAAQQAHQDELAAVLTPMQKAKFVLWMAKRMGGEGGWQGRGGRGGKDMRDGAEGHPDEGHKGKAGKDDDDD